MAAMKAIGAMIPLATQHAPASITKMTGPPTRKVESNHQSVTKIVDANIAIKRRSLDLIALYLAI
jgi:hypothetical protein